MLAISLCETWIVVNSLTRLLSDLEPSYNQPKFSACAKWNPNAVTFSDSTNIGTDSHGLYVDSNNTIYVADRSGNRVQVWLEGNQIIVKKHLWFFELTKLCCCFGFG